MVRNFVESYHGGDIPNSMKPVQIDGCLPKIAFETDRHVQPSEAEEYVLGIDGKIVLVGEDQSEVVAGTLQVLLVLIEVAREHGFAAFDVLDSLTDSSHYLELIDDGGDWHEEVREKFVDLLSSNLLIINQVKVEPKYRGKGLGILAVKTAIDCFSQGCGLVALKPFPLQFTSWQSPDWKPELPLPRGLSKAQAFRSALRKVEKHWARLGFRRIGKTEIWGLCPAHRQPSLDAAMKGIPIVKS
jgi:GNAT superfamily N-acetyltransferase